jgi:UDP-N-acetyl-D-glucosamine dehydrogenase
MITVADEINSEMPAFWVSKVQDALNDRAIALKGAKVLVLGVAYKKDIDDMRESPALEIMDLLSQKGAKVSYHDPYCPEIKDDGHTPAGALGTSVDLTDAALSGADAVMIVTDHSDIDYSWVKDRAKVLVDTRAATTRARPRVRQEAATTA